LLHSKDRFFGSIIVVAYQPDVFSFEPIEAPGSSGMPYERATKNLGVLTLDGGRYLALDGQHRLLALREIVTGEMFKGAIPANGVSDDDICVFFVRHESLEKTRRIFNKVNRHARPTSPSDNIITSEDDGYAIVARWLVEQDPPLGLTEPQPPLALFDVHGEPLVEWRRTTLKQYDTKLTTLSAVYQTVAVVCSANGVHRFDEKHLVNRPSNSELERAYSWSADWWACVLDGIDSFRSAVRQPWRIPDVRQYQSKFGLLFRPVGQIALFHGLAGSTALGLSLKEAVKRCGEVNWRPSSDTWLDVMVRANGHMMVSDQAVRLAGRLITYMIAGRKMNAGAIDRLNLDHAVARGWTSHTPGRRPGLPKRVDE
jgi:DNA sulfur modification protein DndB